MLSFTQQQTIYGDLSGNTSTANLTRGAYLANIEQRYLLQKFFNNEETYTITTVGAVSLTVTAIPAIGATSATLSYAWFSPSVQTTVTFSSGEQRVVTFKNGSTAITWQNGLVGTKFNLTAIVAAAATSATLASAWTFPTASYVIQFSDGEQKTVTLTLGSTAVTWVGGLSATVAANFYTSVNTVTLAVGGVQTYKLPADYSKLKTGTLTIGSLKWTPTEVTSREEWDRLNVFPYYADIPSHFFIWNNQFALWPIPATTGNIITFNYKRRIPDLSIADVLGSAGVTASVTNGSTTVTVAGVSLMPTNNAIGESRWIQIAPTTASATSGDNLWYKIASVDSTTSITLDQPYQGTTVANSISWTIGQMPVLMEDFQDMLIWKPLIFYYSSIVDNKVKKSEFEGLYNEKLALLEEYAGTKTINVNLCRRTMSRNPNLYSQSFGGI